MESANRIMSDTEIDCPFDEKYADNSGHNALSKNYDSMRKSGSAMDSEWEDPEGNIDREEGHRKVVQARRSSLSFVNNVEETPVCDFDSDEYSFADAESDCEPNQFFLDEMLEDSHPERLNLLDYPKRYSNATSSLSDAQNEENDIANDSDDDERKYEESSTSRNEENEGNDNGCKKVNRTLNVDTEGESTSEGSDEVDDSFGNLPTIKDKEKGRRMPLNSYGTSTGVGPGRPLLRQPSQRTVWGK